LREVKINLEKTYLILSLLIPILWGIVNPIYAANNYWTIEYFNFYPKNGGVVNTETTFTCEKWYFEQDYIVFENLKIGGTASFVKVGFWVSSNAQLTLSSLSSSQFIFKVTAPNLETSTTYVWLPYGNPPTSVEGADYWFWDQDKKAVLVKIIHHSTQTVIFKWETPSQSINIPISTLLWQYLLKGDLTGFIIALYTYSLGEIFFGLILLAIFIPLYIRYQSLMAVSVIMILLGSMIEYLVPTQGITMSKILIILGIAGILYRLFVRRE